MNLQWFAGHMTKTIRQIGADIKLVDIVIELVDARIPMSSRNPDIKNIIGNKPHLLVMNKSDMADSAYTDEWKNYFAKTGESVIVMNSVDTKGTNVVFDACKKILADKINHDKEKGIVGRAIKIMVVGIPNVGKSSFINKLSGKKSAKTGDKPGVTRGKQWIRLQNGFELLDTAGILWPKFEDEQVGLKLAYTGSIRDEIVDVEELSCYLLSYLKDSYPQSLTDRYKMTDFADMEGYELLELLGRKRGFVISGGEIDTFRAANILLDEFRGCKLGKITLERP